MEDDEDSDADEDADPPEASLEFLERHPSLYGAADETDELAAPHAHPRLGGSIITAQTDALIEAKTGLATAT